MGAKRLIENHPDERRELYELEELAHSSVVLAEAIAGPDGGTAANPEFEQMTQAMIRFVREHVTGSSEP